MRKRVEPIEDLTVLLSIHDIIPSLEDDVIKTYDLLTDLDITNMTMLVTPFYGMKKTNSFTPGSFFTQFLLSLNLDISLHGYSHFSKSGMPHEFSNLPADRSLSRLKDGYSLMKQSFKQKPIGFIPPMWEAPHRIVRDVKSIGLEYCVIGNNIYRTTDDAIFSTAERIISQGQRVLNFEDAIFEIELGGALQIAIHPSDYRLNNIFELITDLKDRQGFRFISYRDYLKEIRA